MSRVTPPAAMPPLRRILIATVDGAATVSGTFWAPAAVRSSVKEGGGVCVCPEAAADGGVNSAWAGGVRGIAAMGNVTTLAWRSRRKEVKREATARNLSFFIAIIAPSSIPSTLDRSPTPVTAAFATWPVGPAVTGCERRSTPMLKPPASFRKPYALHPARNRKMTHM